MEAEAEVEARCVHRMQSTAVEPVVLPSTLCTSLPSGVISFMSHFDSMTTGATRDRPTTAEGPSLDAPTAEKAAPPWKASETRPTE